MTRLTIQIRKVIWQEIPQWLHTPQAASAASLYPHLFCPPKPVRPLSPVPPSNQVLKIIPTPPLTGLMTSAIPCIAWILFPVNGNHMLPSCFSPFLSNQRKQKLNMLIFLLNVFPTSDNGTPVVLSVSFPTSKFYFPSKYIKFHFCCSSCSSESVYCKKSNKITCTSLSPDSAIPFYPLSIQSTYDLSCFPILCIFHNLIFDPVP